MIAASSNPGNASLVGFIRATVHSNDNMTVGIGAICSEDANPCVIVAADRMVTVGASGGVEYEDTSTKIEPFVDNDDLSAMLVGSGNSTMIDSVVKRAREYVAAEQGPNDTTGAMQYAVAAYKSIVQETVSNMVLSPIGFELADLKDEDVEVPTEVQRAAVKQGGEIRQRFSDNVQLMLATVDRNEACLYMIAGNDYSDFTDMGDAVIGSGTRSARLTFIRRNYDSSCDSQESLFTVMDAKSQAEERQGVGQQVDIVKIKRDETKQYTDDEIENLRENLAKINQQEMEAREKVIEDWHRSN